jgi:hypothetical protein
MRQEIFDGRMAGNLNRLSARLRRFAVWSQTWFEVKNPEQKIETSFLFLLQLFMTEIVFEVIPVSGSQQPIQALPQIKLPAQTRCRSIVVGRDQSRIRCEVVICFGVLFVSTADKAGTKCGAANCEWI